MSNHGEAAVGGHVNMMVDVLIAKLPPADLRYVCRRMLSDHPSLASELRDIVRRQRQGEPVRVSPSAETLATDWATCLQDFRLDFLCGLHHRALQRVTALVKALHDAGEGREPRRDEDSATILKQIEGDIIQCMQAMKESPPSSLESADLKKALYGLWSQLRDVQPQSILGRAYSQVGDAYELLFPGAQLSTHLPLNLVVRDIQIGRMDATIPTISLGPIEMPRLLFGLWQLSSPAWGTASEDELQSSLVDLVQHGFRAADMADHYGDAEIIFGRFRQSLPKSINDRLLTCTKWCVFAGSDNVSIEEWVPRMVKERRDRCGGYLDVLQFHWQDYSDKRYLPICHQLVSLSRQSTDLVKAIGLVNFDSERTDEICTYLKAQGDGQGRVITNQVQYSLIDQRPRYRMAEVCKKHGIRLLTYGTFCGGFLSDKWLDQPAPNLYSDPITPSQRKYYDMITLWGGWQLFQDLLCVLRLVADRHGNGIDIANVATRWVLEKEELASVIVGTRLGVSSNIASNLRVFTFKLTDGDHTAINGVLQKSRAEEMFTEMGDCGAEYRHISH